MGKESREARRKQVLRLAARDGRGTRVRRRADWELLASRSLPVLHARLEGDVPESLGKLDRPFGAESAFARQWRVERCIIALRGAPIGRHDDDTKITSPLAQLARRTSVRYAEPEEAVGVHLSPVVGIAPQAPDTLARVEDQTPRSSCPRLRRGHLSHAPFDAITIDNHVRVLLIGRSSVCRKDMAFSIDAPGQYAPALCGPSPALTRPACGSLPTALHGSFVPQHVRFRA